jgi:hypothetical protein
MGHPGTVKLANHARGLHEKLLEILQGLAPGKLAIFNHCRPNVSENHGISLGFIGKDFVVPLEPQRPETGFFKKNPNRIQLHKVRRQFLHETHS